MLGSNVRILDEDCLCPQQVTSHDRLITVTRLPVQDREVLLVEIRRFRRGHIGCLCKFS